MVFVRFVFLFRFALAAGTFEIELDEPGSFRSGQNDITGALFGSVWFRLAFCTASCLSFFVFFRVRHACCVCVGERACCYPFFLFYRRSKSSGALILFWLPYLLKATWTAWFYYNCTHLAQCISLLFVWNRSRISSYCQHRGRVENINETFIMCFICSLYIFR